MMALAHDAKRVTEDVDSHIRRGRDALTRAVAEIAATSRDSRSATKRGGRSSNGSSGTGHSSSSTTSSTSSRPTA